MNLLSISSFKEAKGIDVLVLPVWQEDKKATPAFTVDPFSSVTQFPLQSGDFLAKEGETMLLYTSTKEKRLLLLGLGKKQGCTLDQLRRAYGTAVTALKQKRLIHVCFVLPEEKSATREEMCRAIIEGVLLANYSFHLFKKEIEEEHFLLKTIYFAGLNKKESALLEKTKALIEAVNFTRDLVNGNAEQIHVDMLIDTAHALKKSSPSLSVRVLDKKRLEKEGLGLLLAVGKGASRPPALILLEYRGDPQSKQQIALVGKGITFDTGGLNLKPTGGIETMKCDMAGAASVLGVMKAISHMKLKKNVLGVLAVAENAIGPESYKPGDVFRSYLGHTVEITNTDAEGRLALADAIAYTEKNYAPQTIIDLATLTGGVVVALGEEATGLFSNDDALAHALERAGERTHERLWRLPLYPEYKERLKSSIAEIKNAGSRKASPGTAAIFLQQFVKKAAWAHLDIAGTAYLSEKHPYHPTSATGVGVRLLVDFLS